MHSRKVLPLTLYPEPERNVEGILKVFENDPELPELLHLWRYNIDSSANGPYGSVPIMKLADHKTSNDMTMKEIETLKNNAQLAPTTWDKVKAVGIMFKNHELKVDEETQITHPRNRVVINPEHINRHVDYKGDTGDMDIQTLKEHINDVQQGDWACVADMMIGFNQMSLTTGVSAYHCILAIDGSYWRQIVASMGFGPNSATLDKLVKMIARISMPPGVRMATHVDGVRFLANNAPELARVAKRS